MSKKKKTLIIVAIVVIAFAIMGFVYALLSDNLTIKNILSIGTVEIEDTNLLLKDESLNNTNVISPADIDTITWDTLNKGTSGVLTRQVLEIYFEEDVGEEVRDLLYMFPANITRNAIEADFAKLEAGEDTDYMLQVEPISKQVTVGGETKTRYGIKYQFNGDTLDGSKMENVSVEVNQNKAGEGLEDAGIIESTKTDDDDTKKDTLAFKLYLSPKTSYLYQGMRISAKVTTEGMQYVEGMQYTDEGWKVVAVQEIP